MYKQVNAPIIYSIFNTLVITLLAIGSRFINNHLFYITLAVLTLATVNIVILVAQLIEKNKLYEEARLRAQKLSYLKDEMLHFKQHRHDIKNHLVVIRELADLGKIEALKEYTNQLTNKTNQALIECQSGLDELDILLYTKKEEAQIKNVDFKLELNVQLQVDKKYILNIISIVSNILDNAIEATTRIELPNERFIQMHMFEDTLSCFIILTNSFSPKYNINPKKAFVRRFTTKANYNNHGLGLSIVKKLVKRHSGNIKVDIFNGVFFQIKIEIPKYSLNK